MLCHEDGTFFRYGEDGVLIRKARCCGGPIFVTTNTGASQCGRGVIHRDSPTSMAVGAGFISARAVRRNRGITTAMRRRRVCGVKLFSFQKSTSFNTIDCSGDIAEYLYNRIHVRPHPQRAQSWGLGPPPFMCARDYVLAFLVLGLFKNEKNAILCKKVHTTN